MNCKDAREMINAYFDNNLDPMRDRLIAGHIQSCPGCRAELDFIVKYRNTLKNIKPVPPPDNFLPELYRKIELAGDKNPVNRLIEKIQYLGESLRFPVEAAGVLAIAAVIFFLYKPFFDQKIHNPVPESVIKPMQEEIPAKKKIINPAGVKSGSRELMKPLPQKRAALKGKNIPLTVSEDAGLPVKDETGSVFMDKKEKALSAESETVLMKEERKSDSPVSPETGGITKAKKISSRTPGSSAEKIFWEADVTIIRKDLSDGNRLFYKIKVAPEKYSALINRLNRDYTVGEKFIKKSKSYYQIELILEKNKK